MRKAIVCICVCLITASYPFKLAFADEAGSLNIEAKTESYISSVYSQINFGGNRLRYEVFAKAYRGYLNLWNAGKLNTDKGIISICDFSLSSAENRLWIIDLNKRQVLYNTYVAHGQGTGDEYATSFSNQANSHKSSLGFYVTGETYNGEHGTSLRLEGMDQGFNDAALERGIVVHGAEYVSDRFINAKDRIGRSWGCPAVPSKLSLPIINTIKDGTCLFIYYPETRYMNSGYWLNKRVAALPEQEMFNNMLPAESSKPMQKTVTIKYMNNGKLDSVRTLPAPASVN